MDSTDLTEFDCVTIGDYASINATATVLYDTRIGDHAQLGILTIIMKGEGIPPNTRWAGAPAQPVA